MLVIGEKCSRLTVSEEMVCVCVRCITLILYENVDEGTAKGREEKEREEYKRYIYAAERIK